MLSCHFADERKHASRTPWAGPNVERLPEMLLGKARNHGMKEAECENLDNSIGFTTRFCEVLPSSELFHSFTVNNLLCLLSPLRYTSTIEGSGSLQWTQSVDAGNVQDKKGDKMDMISILVIVVVCIAVGVTVATMNYPAWRNLRCPSCGTQPPRFRRPKSWHQFLWGGWTCSECGSEMDRHGRPK